MATYALQADFEAYVEGWETTDPAALERLLQRAERMVDLAVGPWLVEDNGLKFGHPLAANEKHLEPYQVTALKNATCAQAEYIHIMGDDFFRRAQYASEQGPDFRTQGRLPRLAPKAREELAAASLMQVAGRARPGRFSSPRARYSSFLDATRHDGT